MAWANPLWTVSLLAAQTPRALVPRDTVRLVVHDTVQQLDHSMPIRLGFVVLGLALLSSIFFYEGEERRLQSRLEEWWIRLDDRSRAAGSRHARFLRVLAAGVGRVLDRLFGTAAVSWQAIAVSVLLALAAYDLDYGYGRPPSPALVWQALGLLAVASLPLVHPRLAVITIGALLALLALVLASAVQLVLTLGKALGEGGKMLILNWLLWFGAIPLSFASALLVLWFERRLLRWLSDGPSLVRAAMTVLACAAAISVVVVGPAFLADVVRPVRRDLVQSQRTAIAVEMLPLYEASAVEGTRMVKQRDPTLAHRVKAGNLRFETVRQKLRGQGLTMQMGQPPLSQTLMDLAAMNVFTILPLLLLLLGAASFAVHRALWELLIRPIYQAQRWRFFTAPWYKRTVGAAGVACLLYGLRVPDALLGALFGH